DVMARYGLGLTRAAIGQLMEAGLLRPAPLDALAAGVFGALSELALFVATAEDPPSAGEEARGALAVLLESLRK
ncbi:MAG TPA: hypothetical protein PKK39_04765, partial [Tepidiformaceae bacterium]|nr:hypothetical protein [Tepidiformaceae bacterium]